MAFPERLLGENEHVVYDLWRLDNRLKNQPLGYPAKHPVRSYFRSNVHIATSGEFSDFALRHVIQEIGADRVLFAIDTPYEDIAEGASWFDAALSWLSEQLVGAAQAPAARAPQTKYIPVSKPPAQPLTGSCIDPNGLPKPCGGAGTGGI